MRENRTSGSEGGAAQTNASFLPLSGISCIPWAPFAFSKDLMNAVGTVRIFQNSWRVDGLSHRDGRCRLPIDHDGGSIVIS